MNEIMNELITLIKHVRWLIIANNLATGARRIFPCWDEAGLKAKFTITIKHSEHYHVHSNTVSNRILTNVSKVITRFQTTPEISTYHIAIVLFDGNDYCRLLSSHMELWCRCQEIEDKLYDFELIKNVKNIVEYVWPRERPLSVHHYIIPGLKDDGMDKFDFVFYREEDTIYNEEVDPIARKIEISRLIGRKMVGQLFTKISSSWWSYMWLNEEFIIINFIRTSNLDDFWTDIQSIYDLQTKGSRKIIVKDIMDPWIKEKRYPVLDVTINYLNAMKTISIKNFEKWTIPLTYTVSPNINFRDTLALNWVKVELEYTSEVSQELKCQWIIVNRQQTGYYRVNYKDEWLNISCYLNSENYTNIHVLNRAQIIDDAFHFVTTNKLHYSVFVELTSYLSQETDYIAWYPMFKAIERMSYVIPFLENTNFKMQLLKLFNPLLRKIKYEENPNEDDHIKCLRQEAIRWACILGDKKCKEAAKIILQRHLRSHQT
ncbi:hypothetical protein P5V15_008541 [Pogonomyrmex californicus]